MKRFLLLLAFLTMGTACAETLYFYKPRLTAHIAGQVDSRIAALDGTKEIYASQDHASAVYVRSITCWARDLDLTCASPWNSNSGAQKGGVLISPRHILFAGHFAIADGSTIRFVKQDGTVVTRTLSSSALSFGDIVVGLLDSAVPAGITFAKLLPATVDGMLDAGTPRLYLDQEEKALINEIALPSWFNTSSALDSRRFDFWEALVSGDSGEPLFVIIRGEAVLCGLQAGGIPHRNLATLNATMTALGGGYQVTTVDLSEFVGGD